MKRTLSPFLMLCFIALSCNKPLPDYSGRPFDYTVAASKTLSIPSNGSVYFGASARLLSGDPANEPVTVTFHHAPSDLFIDSSNLTFRLNYEFTDSFSARNVPPGSYPMQAVFSNAHTAPKTIDFDLVVTDPVNWKDKVIGYYYPSGNCGMLIYVSCEILAIPSEPAKIMIIDRLTPSMSMYGTFDTSYGTMDCCSGTFVIPRQNVNGTSVEGSGHPAGSRWVISRQFANDTASYSCTVTLSH